MSAQDYREDSRKAIRTLFCIGVRDAFFATDAAERALVIDESRRAFADLAGRFGVRVLGTMDDDEVMVGPSTTFPWTAYILADIPDYATAARVCSILRDHPVGEVRLWHYFTIQARLGRPLFFGNE
ncbi:hypothetical protein [Pseudonocardia spinosispora]|uniref:hypothetical protein n=1 Tax=Pseudonocardia spinosispora TaxID=103441 RepID=UPI0004293F94|nr:hypothetical protein [Pseudonocardia spinosispora]